LSNESCFEFEASSNASEKYVTIGTQTEGILNQSVATQTNTDKLLTVEVFSNPATSTPIKNEKQQIVSDADTTNTSTTTSTNISKSFVFSHAESSESESIDSDDDTLMDNFTVKSNDSENYVVFSSNLNQLFTRCLADFSCISSVATIKKLFKGSMVTYVATCCNNHSFTWHSQPIVNNVPLGNLVIAAGTLYTGNTYTTVSEIAQACGMRIFSESTFYHIQRKWLFPTIKSMYLAHQEELHAGKLYF